MAGDSLVGKVIGGGLIVESTTAIGFTEFDINPPPSVALGGDGRSQPESRH
jgi:hypothetical protein